MQTPFKKIFVGAAIFAGTCVVAVLGYWLAGWSLLEAVYMVTITIYGVGYGEVRPVEDPRLRLFTMSVIIMGLHVRDLRARRLRANDRRGRTASRSGSTSHDKGNRKVE